MTEREVEPHSSNSQKELPTLLRFHVKHIASLEAE